VSFSKLFEIEYYLQVVLAVFKPLDFLGWLWYKKGKSKRGWKK
jgi:hypothetical protein